MLDVNQIANIFTDNSSVTMPAENYMFIYKRIQELERERDCYKQQLDILKESADNLKDKRCMLKATTEEQRETILGILEKDNQITYYSFEDWDVENIMIDGNISFDAMAEIVDYLRSQNNK